MNRLCGLLLAFVLCLPARAADGVSPSPLNQAIAALNADDVITAEKTLRPLAESGNADAQHLLGFFYDLGLAVPMDSKIGNDWQGRAAAQDHYWARLYLGWKVGFGYGVDKADPARSSALQAVLYERKASDRIIPEDWLTVSGLKFAPDYRRAARWARTQAVAGNAVAAYTLAEYYYMGVVDRRPNPAEHVRWVKASADGGYAPAMVRLKLYYALGVMTEKNESLSREYLARAAAAGDPESAYELGRDYARGQNGLTRDYPKAREWYARAAQAGYLPAINALADLLRKGGEGVAANFEEARRLSRQAADLHDPEALSDLANMLRRGQGGPKDREDALALYREAAGKKYAYAQYMMGWVLTYDSAPADYAGARPWFEAAAENGNESAMRELGWFYSQGRGVEKNEATAFAWFEKAAREGDGDAQNQLGWMLRQGVGIEEDNEEAVTWFKLAQKNGVWRADANLGYHYLNGRGVTRDVSLAFKHLVAALRVADDDWTSRTFIWLFAQTKPEEKILLQGLLQALVEDPNLLQAVGPLPEDCVLVAHTLGDRPLAKKLVAALEASQRPSAYNLLAWQSFHGEDMPYDLEKARHWARLSLEANSSEGGFLSAYIESVAGSTAEARDSARLVLHKLAAGGNERALYTLVYRCATGLAEPLDPAQALEYFHRLPSGKDRTRAQMYEQIGLKNFDLEEPDALVETAPPENTPPRQIKTQSPHYPRELAIARFRGEVVVSAIIDENGKPQDIKIVSSNHPLMAAAAESTAKRWRFTPGRKNGKPISVRVSQTYNFEPL